MLTDSTVCHCLAGQNAHWMSGWCLWWEIYKSIIGCHIRFVLSPCRIRIIKVSAVFRIFSLSTVCHSSLSVCGHISVWISCVTVLWLGLPERLAVLVPSHKVLQGGGENAGVQPMLPHHSGGKTGEACVSHRISDLENNHYMVCIWLNRLMYSYDRTESHTTWWHINCIMVWYDFNLDGTKITIWWDGTFYYWLVLEVFYLVDQFLTIANKICIY